MFLLKSVPAWLPCVYVNQKSFSFQSPFTTSSFSLIQTFAIFSPREKISFSKLPASFKWTDVTSDTDGKRTWKAKRKERTDQIERLFFCYFKSFTGYFCFDRRRFSSLPWRRRVFLSSTCIHLMKQSWKGCVLLVQHHWSTHHNNGTMHFNFNSASIAREETENISRSAAEAWLRMDAHPRQCFRENMRTLYYSSIRIEFRDESYTHNVKTDSVYLC